MASTGSAIVKNNPTPEIWGGITVLGNHTKVPKHISPQQVNQRKRKMVNTVNNKPGLALFTIITHDFEFSSSYTYITALPYSGKLKKYIDEIDSLTDFFIGLCADAGGYFEIFVETFDFETFAEAKAAAKGATFMDVDENAGMSPVGEVDAEKLQKVVEIMERIRGNIQLTGDEEQDKKEARDAVIAVASETGLWLNPND